MLGLGLGLNRIYSLGEGIPPEAPVELIGFLQAPEGLEQGVITGNPVLGETLTCSPGEWTIPNEDMTFEYRWSYNFGAISDPEWSTDPTFLIPADAEWLLGYNIHCIVRAIASYGMSNDMGAAGSVGPVVAP